jgi:hypothetical protein
MKYEVQNMIIATKLNSQTPGNLKCDRIVDTPERRAETKKIIREACFALFFIKNRLIIIKIAIKSKIEKII